MGGDRLFEWDDLVDNGFDTVQIDKIDHVLKFLWPAHRRTLDPDLAKKELGHVNALLGVAPRRAEENITAARTQGVETIVQAVAACAWSPWCPSPGST